MPHVRPPTDWPRSQDDVPPVGTAEPSWSVRHKVLTSLGLLALLVLLIGTRIGGGPGPETAVAQAPGQEASAVTADPSVTPSVAPRPASAPRPPDPAAVRAHAEAHVAAKARADAEAEVDPAALPQVGDPVVDQQFAFTVTDLECGVVQIGSRWLNAIAKGQFCLVTIDVANIGDRRQAFYGDHQVLVNTKGLRYSPSADAASYLDHSRSVYEQIDPGEQLTARVVYDMPKRSTPDRMDLHASLYSPGVAVVLR